MASGHAGEARGVQPSLRRQPRAWIGKAGPEVLPALPTKRGGEEMGDFEKRISAMYNAPIWALHRLIFDLWLEVLSLRRQVAKDVRKAA